MTPGNLPLAGDRQTPFFETLIFLGLDLTSAVFKLQVRDRKDGGAVRADLATVTTTAEGVRLLYGGTDTIANHITAGRLEEVPSGTNPATGLPYTAADSVEMSQVTFKINETTMEAMPFGTETGDDLEIFWDLHVTPSGGLKQVYLEGTFTVRAGVTQ